MKRFLTLFTLLLLFGFTSCEKEGCTIPEASNYDEKAKKDNGTCVYNGNLLLWYDEETKNIMDIHNITSLTYTIDSIEIGTFYTDTFWEWAPACEAYGSIGRTIMYLTQEEQTITYSVTDNNGVERFSGSVNVTPPACVKQELVW